MAGSTNAFGQTTLEQMSAAQERYVRAEENGNHDPATWLLIAQRRGTPGLASYWALIVLALAATALSYGWALDAVKLP